MRREFALGPDDIRALDALGCPWEAIVSAGVPWLLLHDHPVPPGYNADKAQAAVRMDTYPATLDMVYFYPPLARTDGKTINNLSFLGIDGRSFQQWSRHYTWRQGIDSLCTHLRRVRGWLKHEFRKR